MPSYFGNTKPHSQKRGVRVASSLRCFDATMPVPTTPHATRTIAHLTIAHLNGASQGMLCKEEDRRGQTRDLNPRVMSKHNTAVYSTVKSLLMYKKLAFLQR